jgi:hypothetical protein
MGTGSFAGVKSGLGVTLTPHPLLVPRSRKGRAVPLLSIWAVRPVQSLSACTRVHTTQSRTSNSKFVTSVRNIHIVVYLVMRGRTHLKHCVRIFQCSLEITNNYLSQISSKQRTQAPGILCPERFHPTLAIDI